MSSFKTEQEQFWAGRFGDDYSSRNQGEDIVESNRVLFSRILPLCGPLDSLIEFGSNIGLNLMALRQLMPETQLSAIEINSTSVERLRNNLSSIEIFQQSILDFEPAKSWDLALSKGVLIHINPDELPTVYDKIHQASRRFILIAEYYNPQPVEIPYRGHEGKLFKRDFAGEMMDRFDDLTLVDTGFAYHRGLHPQDDLTWFLLEKQ